MLALILLLVAPNKQHDRAAAHTGFATSQDPIRRLLFFILSCVNYDAPPAGIISSTVSV